MKLMSLFSLFIVVVALGAVTSVLAATDSRDKSCEAFLAAANEKLSTSAQTYIRLVNHYLQREPRESLTLLNQLISAKEVINPFANKTDSLSGLLSDAMKLTIAKIAPQEWPQILEVIKGVARQNKAQNDGRSHQRQQTKTIFGPKVIGFKKQQSAPKYISPFIVGDRILVAVATEDRNNVSKIQLYEIENGTLQKKKSVSIKYKAVSNPEWITAGEKTFLSVTSDDGSLYLFELIAGQLVQVQHLEDIGVVRSLSWRVIGKSAFLAFGSFAHVNIYELVSGRLEKVDTLFIESMDGVTVLASAWFDWHTIEGVEYLAIGTQSFGASIPPYIYLVKFENKKMQLIDDVTLKTQTNLVKVVPLVSRRRLLAHGSYSAGVHLFEIENERLKLIKAKDFMLAKPTSHENELAATIGSYHSREGVTVEITGENLAVIAGTTVEADSTPAWQNINDRIFVTFVNNLTKKIVFKELVNGNLQEVAGVPLKNEIYTQPVWVQKGYEAYVLLMDVETEELGLVSVLNSVEDSK